MHCLTLSKCSRGYCRVQKRMVFFTFKTLNTVIWSRTGMEVYTSYGVSVVKGQPPDLPFRVLCFEDLSGSGLGLARQSHKFTSEKNTNSRCCCTVALRCAGKYCYYVKKSRVATHFTYELGKQPWKIKSQHYRAWFGPKSQNHPKKKPLGWFRNPLLKSFLLWF